MQKNVGIVFGIVILVLLIAMFWMFRGRPAGESQSEIPDLVGSDEISPVVPLVEPEATDASPAAPTASESTVVSIVAAGFTPASVTVPVGGTVSFTNNDTQTHQVASAPHPVHTSYPPLNGAVLGAGETRAVTFTQAGSFKYHDHLNPGLTGTVIVQ